MTIKETYYSTEWRTQNDFSYIAKKFRDDVFIGRSIEGNVAIILRSAENTDPMWQKTKMLSLRTSHELTFKSGDSDEVGIFHVLTCLSIFKDEIDIFLDLCESFSTFGSLTSKEFIRYFNIMVDFFEQDHSYSLTELQGLYGELCFIETFKEVLNFADYWQSREKVKFDFSVTSVLKIEVKTTTNRERTHKFVHEQISSKSIEVYIVSFKLLFDDKGLSLVQLIYRVLPLLENNLKQKSNLLKIIYRCEIDLLNKLKFQEVYTSSNMRIFNSKFVPHFDDVDGVTGATYNSSLENIPSISIEEFINSIENCN